MGREYWFICDRCNGRHSMDERLNVAILQFFETHIDDRNIEEERAEICGDCYASFLNWLEEKQERED